MGGTRNWAIMWMAPAILRALATGVYWGWASVIHTHTSETWAAPFQTVENICAGQVRPAMEHLAERG